MIIQDGLTAFDLADLKGHPKVYQELVTAKHCGKQLHCFLFTTMHVAVIQALCKCMSCYFPVSDQKEEGEVDEPEPPQPFEDWVAIAFPTCVGIIVIEYCKLYYTALLLYAIYPHGL